jgi:hypothetical protein
MRTPIGMPVDRLVACNGATAGTGLARAGSRGAGLTEVIMQETKPVDCGEEHVLPGVAAKADVAQTTGGVQTRLASHGTEET